MGTLFDVSIDSLFCLFKGEPGTRKSTAALSFPTPQYWASTDQKMNSLIRPAKIWGIDFKDIEYDDYTDYNKMNQKLTSLQVNCKYKTIIIDSITSLGDVVNRQTIKSKSGATNKSGTEKGMTIGGIPVNTIDDYKAEASAFQEVIGQLKDIHKFHKCHVVLIAHVIGDRGKTDANQSTHFSRIIVTGGKIISAKIPSYVPEVYHFDIKGAMDADKEGTYHCLTVHTGDDFARTALPLDRKLEFNNDKLYDKFLLPAINKLKEK